jgi:hypothetical protein
MIRFGMWDLGFGIGAGDASVHQTAPATKSTPGALGLSVNDGDTLNAVEPVVTHCGCHEVHKPER